MSLLDDMRDWAARKREHDEAGEALRDERNTLVRQAFPDPKDGPSYRKVDVADALDISRTGLELVLGDVKLDDPVALPAPAAPAAPRRKPKARPKREKLSGIPGHPPTCKCGACVAARAAA